MNENKALDFETKEIKKNKLSNRIIEVDLVRGIAVLFMFLDHFMYDLGYIIPYEFSYKSYAGTWLEKIINFARTYWNWDVRIFIRYIFVFIFLSLTGVCCSFSRSNIKRSLKLLNVAYLFTLFTMILGFTIGDFDIIISFGLLQCVGLSLLIIGLLERIIKNKYFYLAIGILFVGIGSYTLFNYSIYYHFTDTNFFLLTLLEISGYAVAGSDCFQLFFFGGQVFIGYFIGKALYKEKKSLFKNSQYSNNLITKIGRNSLVFYILHQVVFVVIITIILLCFGFKISI